MAFSSRYDEPSDAGAKDTYIQLNTTPDQGKTVIKNLAAVVSLYRKYLAELNLNLPAGVTVEITDRNANGTPGAYLHYVRPTEPGAMGDTSGFSYGIIKYIDGLAPNDPRSTKQLVQDASEYGYKFNPNALAGLLDWKSTQNEYFTGTNRSLTSTQQNNRYGKTHPVTFILGPHGWIYVFPPTLIAEGADPNPYVGLSGAPPIATPSEPPPPYNSGQGTPQQGAPNQGTPAPETPASGTPPSGAPAPGAEGGQTPQPGTPAPEPKATPGAENSPGGNQTGQATPGGTTGALVVPAVEIRLVSEETDTYGQGSHRESEVDKDGRVLETRDLDAQHMVGEKIVNHYYDGLNAKQESDQESYYFRNNGLLNYETIRDWNLKGGLTSYEFKSFDYRGSLSGDHISKYEIADHIEMNWTPRTHSWTSMTIPYKLPVTRGAATPATGATSDAPASLLPQNEMAGLLLPRDYHLGDTIEGSLWKANYAEAFKTVPGLYEFSFPIQSYNFPDGTPNWSGLEIGVKGYGYFPVESNGGFSVHLPMDFKGAPQFQVRQDYVIPGSAASSAQFTIDPPVAAPALPQGMISAEEQSDFEYWTMAYLIDLWNEAFDREDELDWHYAFGEHYEGEIGDLEEDLDDCYAEIDYVSSLLPANLVASVARGMAQDERDTNALIRSGTQELTSDQQSSLAEYDEWANFLDNEADYRMSLNQWSSFSSLKPYWMSPVLSEGKLVALRGSFAGDSYDTHITIGGFPVSPLAGTPGVSYFMPPDGLTAGLNNLVVDTPGLPQTTLSSFYLTLAMSADSTNLLKGQTTKYHVTLSGVNGLPGSAWSSSFDPTDLVSPSEYQGSASSAPAAGSTRAGYVSLSITNQSPGVISMQNIYRDLDAQSFAPSGSFHFDGSVGAIANGGFSILGVARAYLQPELGLGSFPNPTPSQGSGNASANFFNNFNWNVNPMASNAPSNSVSMGSTATLLYDDALGTQPSTPAGNPPPTTAPDAATQRVTDAQKKVSSADSNNIDASSAERAAWTKGMSGVPDDISARCSTAARQDLDAYVAWDKALDEFVKSSTSANNTKLEAAGIARAAAMDELRSARQAAIDRFAPADRAAWQAAHDTLDRAEIDRALAEEELRDARAGLKNLPLPSLLKYGF
jgi:hypothetical protein